MRAQSSLTLIDMMGHPQMFESWFRGPTWDNWLAVLKAAFCLPMSDKEIAFFRTVGDRDPPKRPPSELFFVCGRGAGKDSVASAIIAFTAAMFDPAGKLRPGERALVACIAVDREQAKIVKDYVRSFFHDIPFLAKTVERETADGLRLSNRVDITVHTNSFKSVRGRSMLAAVFDECAFCKDENSSSPDEETYRACRPALARVSGSVLIGISSPYKKSGLLYRKFAKHFGKDDSDVLVIRAASKLMNPTIPDAEIAKDLSDDPAAARAEWLAEWRDDISGWLPLETIEAAVDRGVTVRPPLGCQAIGVWIFDMIKRL